MSVLMIDPQVYTEIYRKFVNYQYNREVNREYNYTFSKIAEHSEKDAENIVKTWCNLNEESYDKRYEKEPAQTKRSYFIDFNFGLPKIDAFQMLKYLQCVRYNIEVCTIGRPLTDHEKMSLDILQDGTIEIMQAIITDTEEYNAAKWSRI